MSFIRAVRILASVRTALLLLCVALLAGCASSSHDGHARGTHLLFGLVNGAPDAIEAGWTVTSANGTVVWNRTETLDAAQAVERIQPLATLGAHRIDLSWGAGHSAVLAFDTADCPGTTHLVLSLASDGTFAETTRECHE